MQWNPEILSKFVAPGISEFTAAEIPDLREQFPEAPHWVVNHFLNSALGVSFKNEWRQVVLGFIRRTHNAFSAYHLARERTRKYLAGNQPDNPKAGQYWDAVSAWEDFALQVSMALDLFMWINQGKGAFVKNDGSRDQRLYEIANLVKHTASAVKSGQCSSQDTVPLWLGNSGILSFGMQVTYVEASMVLADLAKLADEFQEPASLGKASPSGGC
jgi:hypothetical protein